MWSLRNDKVHEKDKIQELEGVPVLDRCIEAQWRKGIGKLPVSEFSCMFRIKLVIILKHPLESRKKWLATIKIARKLYEDGNECEDEFDRIQALSKWIGIEGEGET